MNVLLNVLLVGLDENISAELAKLVPGFISCHFLERKDFPEKIGNEKPEIVVFNLTTKSKSDGFKIRQLVDVIKIKNNQKDPIPEQIFVVSDQMGEDDLRYMLGESSAVNCFYLHSDSEFFDGLDVFRLIMAIYHEGEERRGHEQGN